MVAPHPSLVCLGGLVVLPLFAAGCAAIAQRRWRRRMAWLGKKHPGAGSAPESPSAPPLLIVGIVAGVLLASVPSLDEAPVRGAEPDAVTSAVRWLALAVNLLTMGVAIRLARAGMPPEPNFVLTPDGPSDRDAPLPSKPSVPEPDLLDAREF